jgi:hypothetical protein
MTNIIQGEASYHYLYETEMSLEEIMAKYHPDNIIDMKLTIMLSDGSIHKVQLCNLLKATIDSFIVDGEEMLEEDIKDKEKITKMNPVIKIAI